MTTGAVADALERVETEDVVLEFEGRQTLIDGGTGLTAATQTFTVHASVQPSPASSSGWDAAGRETAERRRFHFRPPLGPLAPKWISTTTRVHGDDLTRRYAVVSSESWESSGYMVCVGETSREASTA